MTANGLTHTLFAMTAGRPNGTRTATGRPASSSPDADQLRVGDGTVDAGKAAFRAKRVQPAYVQVADQLREAIMTGQLLPGDRLPVEPDLAALFGVSRSTVQRAKTRGRQLGLLEWERRFGWAAGRRVERPCAYRTMTPPAAAQKRERHAEARAGSNIQRRSIEAQLRALPTPTQSQIRLWGQN
jgi:DNA-binding transcriptional regulator YhcF (GntR family)